MNPLDMLVVFPAAPSPDLARTLDLAGFRWKAVGSVDEAAKTEPQGGWAGAVISAEEDPEIGRASCRERVLVTV